MEKYAGHMGVAELLKFFQKIMRSGTVSMECGHSLTIPLYRGKGNALQCEKYRGLRLLEHGMKIWERVLYERLKHVMKVGENNLVLWQESPPWGHFHHPTAARETFKKEKDVVPYICGLGNRFDKVP